MGKNDEIAQLSNLLTKALRHRIGSIVNENEFYAEKYAKDSEILMREAEKVSRRRNWNQYDKKRILDELTKKLRQELENKTFISEKKFDIMDNEIESVLIRLAINL